jgi:histidine ammonia-lyase
MTANDTPMIDPTTTHSLIKRTVTPPLFEQRPRRAYQRPGASDYAASVNALSSVIQLTSRGIGPDEVIAVARHNAEVTLTQDAQAAMERGARVVAELAGSEQPAYGVTTGFGALATVYIPAARREELQRALIRSHAAGIGPPLEREVVRAMMLLRARSLAMGFSGTRPLVAEAIAGLLNAGVTPVVPEHGSLGASGDLAPLAHCALALIGEGLVSDAGGRVRPARDALAEAGLEPIDLGPKEGLALINGTDGMLGMLVMAIDDLRSLTRVADVAAAMSVEALLGTDRAFAEDLIALRPQAGQASSAANLRALLDGSEIVASHREDDPRVQDAYSLRCAPQVAGAARDTLAYAEQVAEAELRSAIDNPMVLPDGRVESCGNFHGAPVAFACDFLAVAAAEVGAIAERRTDRLLDATRSHGLPPFLAEEAGVNSGLMLAHYAQAALVAENRRLAAPASVDSLPTSAMQEDHVSMGWGAARKLRSVLTNLCRVLTVELVCAGRGLDLRAPLRPAPGTAAALAALRERVPGPGPDRFVAPELSAAEALVRSGALVRAVEDVVGALR